MIMVDQTTMSIELRDKCLPISIFPHQQQFRHLNRAFDWLLISISLSLAEISFLYCPTHIWQCYLIMWTFGYARRKTTTSLLVTLLNLISIAFGYNFHYFFNYQEATALGRHISIVEQLLISRQRGFNCWLLSISLNGNGFQVLLIRLLIGSCYKNRLNDCSGIYQFNFF